MPPVIGIGGSPHYTPVALSGRTINISSNSHFPLMDSLKIASLENLLRLPGAVPAYTVVPDASVLSCGCLVSEAQYSVGDGTCPTCSQKSVILKPVTPLRDLYKLIQQLSAEVSVRPRRRLSLKRSVRVNSELKLQSFNDSMDLMELFCKYAKDDAIEAVERVDKPDKSERMDISLLPVEGRLVRPSEPLLVSISPQDRFIPPIERQRTLMTHHSGHEELLWPNDHRLLLVLMGLSEKEEYNFSRCFPFYRKVSAFQTQQNKLLFSRGLVKKSPKFVCSAISTHYDRGSNSEKTTFVLVSERKWELYEYSNGKPVLVAFGKLTGEYGVLANEMKLPVDDGIVIRNEFTGNDRLKDVEDIIPRLKSWVQLYCCLSEKYLVISGTTGLIRVLNVDSAVGPIGAPVYTYLTNFPIRCISISPNNNLIACGITARERITGKQQPFIIVHKIDTDGLGKVVEVTPITITVPFRDPLKIMSFNASSTHLLCCTVYEMRYFIIRLRGDATQDYKKPRLIWSDMRVNRTSRKKRDDGSPETEDIEESQMNPDDQMLDNEGITDLKFGLPFSNTVVVTSSSLKNRPAIVLKLNGPTIDSRKVLPRVPSDEFFYDMELHVSATTGHDDDDDDYCNISDTEVIMKVPEIGLNIYKTEVSPRGDGIVFVDKLGRLLLVSSPNLQLKLVSQPQTRNRVVLLGESADALRFSEATSVKYSSDGGKVFAVDRKGLFQVFDFTKGVPGEDPDVIKCKIISI